MSSRQHLRQPAVAWRAAALAFFVAALALYGLVGAGVRPIALQPVAAPSIGANSGLSVSEAISPTNQSVNVATRGPNNSLRFYWQVGGTWYGPLGLGGINTTYSAPSITSEGNGNFDIAVEGPGHSMWFYWDASGSWYGPLQIAPPGSTFSTPALDVDSNGHLALLADGPGNTLYYYWNIGGTWYGPLGIGGAGSTFSAPSISVQPCSPDCTAYAFAVGPNNDLRQWKEDGAGTWTGPREWSSDQRALSSPASYGSQALFTGPNHSLLQGLGAFSTIQVSTAGTAYSAPTLTSGASVTSRATAEGPSNSLNFWHTDSSDNWTGPSQVAAPGTTFSAPAMQEETEGGTLDVAVQGPGNSLYAYWNVNDTWFGPLQVAGAGTTFGSAN